MIKKTKLVVVGNPVSHSSSPVMHRANFNSLGSDNTYEALNILIENFHLIKEIISKKELEGSDITIPHKERITSYLDYVDEQTINAGAVNTVSIKDGERIGYNTDGIGYAKGLHSVYPDLESTYILVLGAGGTSKGTAHELVKFAKPKLAVADRTVARFESWNLNTNQISLADAEKYLAEFDIVINITSVSMAGNNEGIINSKHLSPNTLTSDIVCISYKIPILEETERKGNHTYNGLDMFVYQGAGSFRIWTNKDTDINSMKTTVLQQLKGE